MKKLFLVLSILILAATAQAANLVTNGDFETGSFSPWFFFTNGVGTSTIEDGETHIDMAQRGTNTQLSQPGLRIKKSTLYRVSFDAALRTEMPFPKGIWIVLLNNASPYENLGINQFFMPSTAWQRFSFDFKTVSHEVPDARLMFWLGASDVTGHHYYIDNVMLEEVSSTTLLPCPYFGHTTVTSSTTNTGSFGVVCKTCGAVGPIGRSVTEAESMWNTRD